MRMIRNWSAGIVVTGLLIAGFLFAMRGCLSAYDRRSAFSPVLYFKNDQQEVLFSLVKYQQTNSYVQRQGMTSTTFSNSYFVQLNDATDCGKILNKKIEGHASLKNYAEDVLGGAGDRAWIFLDGLTAFNAFTLEKVADAARIEKLNPALTGKLPAERRYYTFNNDDHTIRITATDGSKWSLNCASLLATADETLIKPTDPGFNQVVLNQYLGSSHEFVSFPRMLINQDTAGGEWRGMYSAAELATLNENVLCGAAGGHDERRRLLTASYSNEGYGRFIIHKKSVQQVGDDFFLDGGWLKDKKTGKPIEQDGYFIAYKSAIGDTGKIMLCRVTPTGKKAWSVNTGLVRWTNWFLTAGTLIVTGANNKRFNTTQNNLLLSVNTHSGEVHRYDFFSDSRLE